MEICESPEDCEKSTVVKSKENNCDTITNNPLELPLLTKNEKIEGSELLKISIDISNSSEFKFRNKNDIDTSTGNLSVKKDSDNKGNRLAPVSVQKRQKGFKKYLGITLAILAAIQFSLSALIIKILDYHPFNLGIWRFAVMVLIPIPFLLHAIFIKHQNIFKPFHTLNATLGFLAAQAILGSNSLVLLFYALQNLNVADTLVISTSAPVFVGLLAWMFLGERAGLFSILTAIVTIIGVVIISKPPIFTGNTNYDENLLKGALLSFGSMMCLSTCYVIIRYLRTVNHALINFCFSLWGLGESIVMAIVLDVAKVPANYTEVGLIITTAFLAFFAQTFLTLALKYEQAGPVSLVRTSEVIFAFIWQLVFLHITPDLFSLLGAGLVISAVIFTALRKIVVSLPEDHRLKRRLRFILL